LALFGRLYFGASEIFAAALGDFNIFPFFFPSQISNDHYCIAPIRIIPLAEIFGV
jgi:hypothetical protein